MSSTHPNIFATPGEAVKPEQLELPAAAPTFIPIRFSDSGALVLDPGQTQDAYVMQLQKLRHSKEVLMKAGYVMQPLTEVELDQKKKCGRCHKRESTRFCDTLPTERHRSDRMCSCLQEGRQTHL